MTVRDWLSETRARYGEQPPVTATRRSLRELAAGGVRRTIDPHLGRVWWDRDWDVLVVMDGCRVDLAREVLDEPVDAVWSPASTSIDWIERHFAGQYRDEWTDTAYVTANPFADHDTTDARSADLGAKPLGHFDPVYKRAWQRDPVGTTPPGAVTDAALEVAGDHERLIVHYMQPHQPFRCRPEWEGVFSNLENLTTEMNHGGADIWHQCRDGAIDDTALWRAYRDNLAWVDAEIRDRMLPGLPADATVAVTADHGNGMGEFGVWSHPPGTIAPAVRRVPVVWHEETGPQESVPARDSDAVSTATTDQLAALGYT